MNVLDECKTCPYVKEEYELRTIYFENKTNNSPAISQSCFCEKLGGKTGYFGFCTEEDINKPVEKTRILSEKEKKLSRRIRNKKIKKRWKKKSDSLCSSYLCPYIPTDKFGNYAREKEDIAYYKKISKSSHSKRYRDYKKIANRKVRRYFKTNPDYELFIFCKDWPDCEWCGGDYNECGLEYHKTTDIHDKYSLGRERSSYKKVEYAWQ